MPLENVSKRILRDCYILFRAPGIFWIVPINGFSVTYTLNEIPTATVQVPLGKNAISGTYSPAYALLSSIFYRVPAFIFFSIANTDNHPYTAHISTGTYLVFAGFISGTKIINSFGETLLEISLTHWLGDFNNTSILSSSSNPNNPKSAIFDPRLFAASTFPGLSLSALSTVIVPNFGKAVADFWTGAIFPFLDFLISTDRINVNLFRWGTETAIAWMKWILRMFQLSRLRLNTTFLGDYVEHVVFLMIEKLFGYLQQSPQNGEAGLSWTADDVEYLASLAHVTLWQKLVELAKDYMFMIVPYPLFYQIVPFTVGLRAYYNPYGKAATITPDEILATYSAFTPPSIPLRAVCVYTGLLLHAGSSLDPSVVSSTDIADFGGYYIYQPDPGVGRIDIIRAPDYLVTPFEPSVYTRSALGYYSARLCSSRNPIKRSEGILAQQKLLKTQKISILDKYAQMQYISRILEGRQAKIICPFRGDIAPGSTISYIPENTAFLPTGLPNIFYGLVASVEYSANDQSIPTTTYTLIHIRNYAENQSDNFSTSYNLMYDPYWIGGPHLLVG